MNFEKLPTADLSPFEVSYRLQLVPSLLLSEEQIAPSMETTEQTVKCGVMGIKERKGGGRKTAKITPFDPIRRDGTGQPNETAHFAPAAASQTGHPGYGLWRMTNRCNRKPGIHHAEDRDLQTRGPRTTS